MPVNIWKQDFKQQLSQGGVTINIVQKLSVSSTPDPHKRERESPNLLGMQTEPFQSVSGTDPRNIPVFMACTSSGMFLEDQKLLGQWNIGPKKKLQYHFHFQGLEIHLCAKWKIQKSQQSIKVSQKMSCPIHTSYNILPSCVQNHLDSFCAH